MSRMQSLGGWSVAFLLVFGGLKADAQTGVLGRASVQLLENEAVRKEIGYTEDQKQKVAQVQKAAEKRSLEFRKEYQANIKALAGETRPEDPPQPGTENPSRKTAAPFNDAQNQLQAEARQVAYRLDRDESAAIGKVLRPEQVRRLLEINLRQLKWRAFRDPELARRLNIDEEKFLEVQELIKQATTIGIEMQVKFAETTKALMPGRTDGIIDREKYTERLTTDPEYRKKMEESRASYLAARTTQDDRVTEKILRVLTRRQRETYVKLLGEPFDVGRLIPPLPGRPTTPATPAGSPTTKPLAPKDTPQPPATKSLRERRGSTG